MFGHPLECRLHPHNVHRLGTVSTIRRGSPSKVSRPIPQAGNCAPKSAIKRPDSDEVSLDSVRLIFYTPDDLLSMGSWRVGSSYSRPWFLEGEGCSG